MPQFSYTRISTLVDCSKQTVGSSLRARIDIPSACTLRAPNSLTSSRRRRRRSNAGYVTYCRVEKDVERNKKKKKAHPFDSSAKGGAREKARRMFDMYRVYLAHVDVHSTWRLLGGRSAAPEAHDGVPFYSESNLNKRKRVFCYNHRFSDVPSHVATFAQFCVLSIKGDVATVTCFKRQQMAWRECVSLV